MKGKLLKSYAWISQFILGRKLPLFADIVLLVASTYFLIKKGYDLSISNWLRANLLQDWGVDLYIFISVTLLITSVLIKIAALVFENFPIVRHTSTGPEEIATCLQVMNSEIASHIKKCGETPPADIRKLSDQHSYDVNSRLIVTSMAEHIRKSIKTIKIKRKDLFISLYSYNVAEDCLDYEFHYDVKRDLVKSKKIGLSDQKFRAYQCVMCMKTSDTTSYVLDKRQYTPGDAKRSKTVRHYMGCKLESGDRVFGFLNLEFHNHSVFVSEDEMVDFMEESIIPFKLLLEYQHLKRTFFLSFNKFEDNWKLAKR